jgi:peptidoglycan hydrolase CwlO-like protein
MAEKIPGWALPGAFPNKSLYDKYDMQRSWLTDTAETPEDQKNLKRDLQNLRKQYEALKKSPTLNKTFAQSIKPTPKATTKKPMPSKPTAKSSSKARVTPTPRTTKKAGKK